MSETHVNAYVLELQEKKAALVALQGEVDSLQAIVDRDSPEEVKEEKAKKAKAKK